MDTFKAKSININYNPLEWGKSKVDEALKEGYCETIILWTTEISDHTKRRRQSKPLSHQQQSFIFSQHDWNNLTSILSPNRLCSSEWACSLNKKWTRTHQKLEKFMAMQNYELIGKIATPDFRKPYIDINNHKNGQ